MSIIIRTVFIKYFLSVNRCFDLRLFFLITLVSLTTIDTVGQVAKPASKSYYSIIEDSSTSDEEKRKKIDSLFLHYEKNNLLPQIGYDAHEYGKLFYKKDLDVSLFYAKKAENILKTLIPYDLEQYYKSIYNIALYYHLKKNPVNAIKYDLQFVAISDNQILNFRAYKRLSDNYFKIGDYYQALSYHSVLDKLGKQLNYKGKLYVNHINAATNHKLIGGVDNYKKGILSYQKADSIIATYDKELPNSLFPIYSGIANLYNLKGNDTANALLYYQKARDLGFKYQNDEWVCKSYIDLGSLYREKDLDSSLYFLNQAQKYVKDNIELKYIIYNNTAESYMNNNQYGKALESSKKALSFSISNKHKNDTILPTSDDLKAYPYKTILIETLANHSEILMGIYKKKEQLIYLKRALKSIKLADQLVDIIRFNSDETKSKLYWRTIASDMVYKKAIKICFLLKDHKTAYHFIEKNKALLLLEDVNTAQFTQNIPDVVIDRELELKREIAKAQNSLNLSKTDKIPDSLKSNLLSQKEKYIRFIDSLNTGYPQYSNFKRNPKITTLSDATAITSKEHTSFIQYILDDEQGFGLVITNEKTDIFEIKDIDQLKKDITIFSTLIAAPFNSKQDQKTYQDAGKRIYNQLIPEHIRSSLTKKITIIPDYSLHHIPFEALINENNQYVIEEKEIGYVYSISFLTQNKNLSRVTQKEFLGFAPIEYSDHLSTLPNSKTEVHQISSNFNSTILLHGQASKQNLIDHLSNYEIIHLSTHANANDSITPWISAADEKITLNDIYATKNNAELVVLSACNTSLGSVEKGEGVMSLARGFFNTGANSVVSTLWKADDKSTLALTTDFYKYLKKGHTKSAALRKAKLNYLKSHSLSEASPYYWSSLVLIGNPDALPSASGSNIWIFVLGILLSLSIFTVFYLKKRK